MARRPGHEKVRTLIYELLVNELGVPSTDIDFETQLVEIRGRTDALLGYTVFEFKRNLRAEMAAVEEKLPQYLADREKKTGQRFVGIATDGADFLPFRLRLGKLEPLKPFKTSKERPRELVEWLDGALSLRAELEPTPELIKRELGRDSLAYQVAQSQLREIWGDAKGHPDVLVKRDLWARFLEIVYGSSVAEDDLFFQHTYLTVVAKTMATKAVGIELPEPEPLLSGQPFHDAAIHGAVESDFFDWVLSGGSKGADWVRRVCRQAARFRLEAIQHDVLKGLYESLIDPEQRHDLGEYYTPDWLAATMCDRVVSDPLNQRVLDPACGSGTFVFHSVRRLLAAADEAGLPNKAALDLCVSKVFGVDIHPVAVIIARVTYLLALGERLRGDRSEMSIPVYLGDSLQWNTEVILTSRAVRIEVPGGPALLFPWSVTADPSIFDAVIGTMLELSEDRAAPSAFAKWLNRKGFGDEQDRRVLLETYSNIVGLHKSGRDHIWGYVARNLSRPIWLSSEEQRAEVVIGNPPWLSYRYMSTEMQRVFRDESKRLGVWVGGRGRVSHQDLSGYFFARCSELYVKTAGSIAFVMPYAALTRHHFEKFRTGRFASRSGRGPEDLYAAVDFVEAWGFDERVQPLFEVPSCVLIAIQGKAHGLPDVVFEFQGKLPRRDATYDEARKALSVETKPLAALEKVALSPYSDAFRNGAIVYPRALFVVERVTVGHLGGNPAAPLVRSRKSTQEKPPWRDLPRLEGTIEAEFLRPLYMGESIAPFRLLEPVLAVLPWDDGKGRLLSSETAAAEGLVHLHHWLIQVEKLWKQHGKKSEPITARLDYFHQLSSQMPPAAIRVLYAKSGTLPVASILRDPRAVVENRLYWAAVSTEDEAKYLEAILSSETARALVAHLQSRGQWGARDFDKVMFQLPIPTFDPADPVHRELVLAAERSEAVAAGVAIRKGHPFIAARQIIRRALAKDGVDATINGLVERLLQPRVQAVAP